MSEWCVGASARAKYCSKRTTSCGTGPSILHPMMMDCACTGRQRPSIDRRVIVYVADIVQVLLNICNVVVAVVI